MAAAAQSVPTRTVQPGPPLATAPDAENVGRALVPSSVEAEKCAGLEIGPDSAVARLPVELEVGVPIREFRVRNLLALAPRAVVASQWNHGEDLPLSAGNVQLAWAEFEVVDTTLAARLTRVA